jgi:hypothetical protein
MRRAIVLISISLLFWLGSCRDFTKPLDEFSVTFQQGVKSYTGTKDTHILEWGGPMPPSKRDNNAGANDSLAVTNYVGGSPTERAILVEFDLSSIPSSAEVEEALLLMGFIDTDNGNPLLPKVVNVYRITSFWEEGTGTTLDGQIVPPASGVTWNTQPSYDPEVLDSVSIETHPGPPGYCVWYSFDITSAVKKWVDHPFSNYGVLIIQNGSSPDDGLKLFASSEYSTISYRPKLTVTYMD